MDAGQPNFNPGEHLMKIRGKNGMTDYMQVQWRIVWLRHEHPNAIIDTEKIAGGMESNYAEFKATVSIPGGGSATGYGSETKADFGDFIEKAETKALGRAIAALGYGTQFVGNELDEGERIVDSPVPVPAQPPRQNTANPPPAFVNRPRETPTAAPAPTDTLAMARQHALKQFGPVPATLPEVEAQLAPLAKQVRTNDEALSPGEYQRYHDLEARRKELNAVSNKLFTATDFGKLVDMLWQLAEDGAALARIKDELNGSRHRMTREMMDEARLALAKIEAQFYAPASIAG